VNSSDHNLPRIDPGRTTQLSDISDGCTQAKRRHRKEQGQIEDDLLKNAR
tara:strand:+ start:226 stop:375 length:150 start_codon:yes stop_codon:yes gene_type:complete